MTTGTDSQGSSPPAPPAPPPGGGQGGDDGNTLPARVGALETEQKRQGGILDKLAAKLLPGDDGKAPAAPGGQGGDAGGLSVAEQVRRGVAEIEAERQAKAAADQAAADAKTWRESVEQRLAERRPAEPTTGRRAGLQRFLFGKADQR